MPKVIDKVKNHLALQIRKLAETHDIPTVEDPPPARALYASVEIYQEIPSSPPPLEHYRALAEIIGYVYNFKGKKLVSN